ncbi:MAG: glyoxylase I family protein [Candidatus Poriferisodalaceae bacterium]|jgi:glyoxylase I family protein
MDLGPVHHVSINVASVAEVAPFYTEVLGMKALERPDFPFDGRWLQTPSGGEVHLIEVDGWVPPKGQHWAFKVDDIDGTVTDLRSRGVEVRDPRPLPGTTARQTFFFDPAGNMIEINQPV